MSLQYVIDGYNVINHPLYSRSYKKNQSSPPQNLLSTFISANRLTGSAKNKVIIVFDGYPDSRVVDYGAACGEIIFSRGESADEKIKRLVEESANRKNIIVVSNDKEIRIAAKSLGARCLEVEEFIAPEKKSKPGLKKDVSEQKLNYSQIEAINKELSKLWLK